MDRDDPVSPASTKRARARVGLLGALAAAATAVAVLALTGLSGTNGAAPAAPKAAPKVDLAAAQLGALQSLQALGAAAAPQAPAAPAGIQVAIQNYAFAPAALSVPVGTTVVWTNKDVAPHTVTISSGPVKFTSPNMNTGDTFTYTFTTPGTYSYYCAVHPNMVATLTVTGVPTTPPPPPSTTSAPPPTTATVPPTSMTMPPPTGAGTCLVSGVLDPFIAHVNAGHLGESPGQQVQDILNLNQYVLTHTELIKNMLDPLTNGGLVNVLSGILTPFVAHVDAGHLSESLGQQVQDITNLNQYVLTHTELIKNMLAPLTGTIC
jgi:plastocyanin